MLEFMLEFFSLIGGFFSPIYNTINQFLAPYADYINGTFEALGSIFILNHCRVLWKSKQAHGISLLSTAFFAGWGFWNIYFYPHLDQFWSFVGGVAIVIANTVWIWMIWHIRRQELKNRYVMSDTPPKDPINGQRYFDVVENVTKKWVARKSKWVKARK